MIKSNITKIILFTFVFVQILYSQSERKIYGYIYDKESNAPLVGANIIIDGSGVGTSSDEFGFYQFENILSGKYSITVSYVGYIKKSIRNIEIKKDNPERLDFYLTKNLSLLNEIIVSSRRDDAVKIHLYTEDEIAKSNYKTVGELINSTPGVEIESSGGIGSRKEISIRGSESNQVLVLIDGIPINNQFGGAADLSSIPTNIIERIEIYEGGNSAKFGSGAIGGVVNIITKKNFTDELRINLSAGSFGMYGVEPSISGGTDKLNFYLSYNFLYSKGDYDYTGTNTNGEAENKYRLNSDIKRNNFYGRINYNYKNYLISINAENQKSERGLPGNTNLLTPYARNNNNNTIYGISLSGNFNKIVSDVKLEYYKNETENINLYPEDAPFEYKRIPRYHYNYYTKTYLLDFKTHYNPYEWYGLSIGYSLKKLYYKDENLLFPAKNINEAEDLSNGIFLYQKFTTGFDNQKIGLSITPVIRYDNFYSQSETESRREEQFSPSLSAFISIWKENQIFIKGTLSKSFRVPTFSDLFYQDVRISGKPDLLPEKSFNQEIGFGFTISKKWKVKGEFTYFRNRIDDMIVWELGSFEVFRPFNNDAEIRGESYFLKLTAPEDFLSIQAGYTHLTPLDKNNNKTTFNKIIPYKPQHSVKTELRCLYNSTTVSLKYRFVGKRYVTTANTVELPYYNVFDFTIFQELKLNLVSATLNFSVENILNEKYETVRFYPMPGREYRFGLSLIY